MLPQIELMGATAPITSITESSFLLPAFMPAMHDRHKKKGPSGMALGESTSLGP